MDLHASKRDTLAPHTVATITVTDTLINDETYLHIPYWSPFGTEYYRLDDSLRVWNHNPVTGADSVFLNLGRSGSNGYPNEDCHDGEWCLDVMEATDYCRNELQMENCPEYEQEFDLPIHWAYQFRNTSLAFMFIPEFIFDFSKETFLLPTVWSAWINSTSSGIYLSYAYLMRGYPGTIYPQIYLFYGLEGPGSNYHIQGASCNGRFTWGIFRPAGGTEWDLDNQIIITGIDDDDTNHPSEPDLAAYPNPFNPEVTIRYYLSVANLVNVSVFTTSGQHILTLTQDYQSAGDHSINWDGRNVAGTAVGSGVYIVRLTNGTRTATTRVTLVR